MRAAILACFFLLFAFIALLVWIGGSPLMACVLAVSFGSALAWAEAAMGS
jgi:hypothetical protein